MLKNLMLWLDDTQLTVSLLIDEFVTYLSPTKVYLIGGILASLVILLIISGCTPQIITRCGADRSLIQQIPIQAKPEKPINGDLATAYPKLVEVVLIDNERKARLAKQLQECQ